MTSGSGTREIILNVIRENPGIHFRAIQRVTGLATGHVEYHLYQLEKDEQIKVRKDGRFKRYFLYATSDPVRNNLGFHLRSRNNREIIFYLFRKRESTIEEIINKCGKNSNESLKELQNDNIVIIEKGICTLRNPESLREAIKKSKKSFLEELAESLIDILDEKL